MINPAPPGPIGGQYRPLSEADCQAVLDMALRLLAELGMGEVPDRLADLLISKGARSQGDRILLPEALVRDCIALTSRKVTLHGRDAARSVTIGGDAVHYGTGGAAVQVLDLETGQYRPSTLRDLHDFTRLQDKLENIAWFTRCCIATDVADNFELEVNTANALLRNTTKPVAMSFTMGDYVAPIVEMFDIAGGGKGSYAARPFVTAHVSPIISPLRYGEDAVEVAFACVAHGVPIACLIAAQAGATGPAPLANFLAHSLAETLAGLVMIQCMGPGHPMIFGNWPFVIDLRTGAFVGGGAETALMNAASAQLSNWLGLPSGVAASMTDAKVPDAQFGMEKGVTALAAGLAGGNMIYESAGMMAALMGASFEAFVLDNDMIGHLYRVLRGIEMEALDFGAIRDAVLGEGHFLGGPDTMAAMERDYYYPALADREAPRTWEEAGALDARDRAKAKAREILMQHDPRYLRAAQEAEIARRFNILQ
ncbi:Trimethylamine methyltransferase family protein [Candidatus Rhodobacter oscarellae]|uniref:Trimethylamine methyltransferase family protein n=1 Tax=Candidatus Rhodobacter oscarellae TaxID=1675527 RepID=A0A0J9E8C9_9RHOB|nr:Trimethylamine methyltransferase family protein [Candidatus Rhodobacter lobularis]